MTRLLPLLFTPVLTLAACASSDPGPQSSADAPASEVAVAEEPVANAPAATSASESSGAGRHFGEDTGADLPVTALATLMANPEQYDGTRVKTAGEISQVCQRMGCWMELRPVDGAGGAVRVPMAGHSFFLPRDVAGRQATVVGDVEVRELDADTQAHLESEGAEAADVALGISAVSVFVR